MAKQVVKMKLIKQFDESDCGAACLAMICCYYKNSVSITQIREITYTDRQGTSLKGILNACNFFSLDAKVAKADSSILKPNFPVPFIAHLQFNSGSNHYVVVYKIKKYIYIADPASSKKKISISEFSKIWTGYIILISPTPNFKPSKEENILIKFGPIIKPHIQTITAMVIASLFFSIIGIASSMYFKFFIDDVINTNSISTLHSLSLGLIILTLFSRILILIRSQLLRLFTIKTNISLSLTYIKHILNLPMQFFDTRKVGEILTRLEDCEKVRTTLSNIALGSILDFIIMILVGLYLFVTNSKLFLLVLITIPLSSIIMWAFSFFFSKNYRLQMEENSNINSYLIELLNGINIIKSTNCQDISKDKYEAKLVKYLKLGNKAWTVGNIKELLAGIINEIGANLIFWVGGYLILKDSLTLGQLISFNTLSGFFTAPLNRFIELFPQIQEAIVAAARLGELLELPIEKLEEGEEKMPINIPIEFENVTFRYGLKNTVLNDLSFTTDKYHNIAIVGSSGCGKSTLIKLLMKYYKIENGYIKFNNVNIENIKTKELRNIIGYVPQDIFLFNGTIYDNIVMGRTGFTITHVIEACQKAQATSFIEALPNKYFAQISEKGASLSGGERQRICLARALLANPKILLLDEATSALDNISEQAFQKVIDKLSKENLITITIAHRLSTVKNCDQIYVINNGKIAEQGTHKELVKKQGIYSKLWNN